MVTPNQLHPGESLLQFHQRIISFYPPEKIAPAVEALRDELPDDAKREIRAAIAQSPDAWATPFHHGFGTAIRNFLRTAGFGETYWPIWNLDDIYVMLVEAAVKPA
jgi:hypothetical protein